MDENFAPPGCARRPGDELYREIERLSFEQGKSTYGIKEYNQGMYVMNKLEEEFDKLNEIYGNVKPGKNTYDDKQSNHRKQDSFFNSSYKNHSRPSGGGHRSHRDSDGYRSSSMRSPRRNEERNAYKTGHRSLHAHFEDDCSKGGAVPSTSSHTKGSRESSGMSHHTFKPKFRHVNFEDDDPDIDGVHEASHRNKKSYASSGKPHTTFKFSRGEVPESSFASDDPSFGRSRTNREPSHHSRDSTKLPPHTIPEENLAPDFYKILGVSRNAKKADQSKGRKLMAAKFHPDRVHISQAVDAPGTMAAVNQAYDVLSDDSTRLFYDATGQWPPRDVEKIVAKHLHQYKEMKAWNDIQEAMKR